MDSKLTYTYEGPICCLTLDDGTKLYGPWTVPSTVHTRKSDQITICGANGRRSSEILAFEELKGILQTNDVQCSMKMKRWTLVDILGYDILERKAFEEGSR